MKMTVDSAAKHLRRRAGASIASKAAIEALAPLLAGAAFVGSPSQATMVGSVIGSNTAGTKTDDPGNPMPDVCASGYG